ncbi:MULTISPECIES: DNA topoisomerase IB [Pseudomonas]|uniref:DNA topoisomerase n=3 Tax=Pseudomonas TaxID=286 RepID=A0AAX0VSZ1_9PSED|nr:MULTISPECIES: DNA topoisomerase IB [Pseudomonas]MBH3358500.1 DNA topoisomerase IB [Pseudomonas guariconensis]MCO7623819.1 DNA topoisomerase IB [Pseudomonas guariconensis]MDM9594631.1 DNA topoisomerase IB [Pseudomonas guariconensis]MDM9607461.1 DNA topoisomerase IB [Pseudomonas guariconensis]MDM9612417.1 DNA topoisomerase IB [Pseudomonas guariconensis]
MLDCPLPQALHYVDDSQPGLTRRRWRDRFHYFDTDGKRIRDAQTLARIAALAIPPAYTAVWICPDPQGHLQATGRDARGRKQYRYHAQWRELRDQHKYDRMLAFAQALPRLRRQLDSHLARPGLDREKVMALVVSLLDTTLIRIGNRQYLRENNSYGLTTLRNRHVQVQGSTVRFQFRGKRGVEHDVSLRDRRLARLIKRCLELPGQTLFQYLDEQGQRHAVGSSEVNQFLQQLTGADFTAKDYRTWAGSALALDLLRPLAWQPESEARRQVAAIVRQVATRLGNTPAVCRRCYIHPAVLEHYQLGRLATLPKARARQGLEAEEAALLRFLQLLGD